MPSPKLSAKKIISALALSSCFLTGIQGISWADSNPGLTLFSGVKRENLLSYNLQFGGRPNAWDRYKLYIPAKKMTQGASKIYVDYPESYTGKFDPDDIEVRVKGESWPLREVYWDQESRLIEIDLEKPIEESTKVEVVLSNVKNPRFGGTFYFNCQVMAAGDVPIRLYLGTWILTIQQ
jgi:hypothetical protein